MADEGLGTAEELQAEEREAEQQEPAPLWITPRSNGSWEPDDQDLLQVVNLPDCKRLRRGETVSYDGLVVEFDGRDVTDDVFLDPPEGSVWPARARQQVRVVYVDRFGTRYRTTFNMGRRQVAFPAAVAFAMAVAAVVAFGPWWAATA